MAYQSSTATSIADLMDKLATFAVAQGWTKNEPAGAPTDRLFLSRGTVFVAFRWATASPTAIAIYQATGYGAGTPPPDQQTNDSGNGVVSAGFNDAAVFTSRYARVPNGTMTYWFFEDDTYLHVVVTTAALTYSHFGFGELVKLGTWTGGAYSYGHAYNASGSSIALSEESSFLLDGALGNATAANYRQFAATLRIESLPNQAASGKWALVWSGGDLGTDAGNDRQTPTAVARGNVQGGFRAGPVAASFGRFSSAPTTGLVAMYPINLYYDAGNTPKRWYPLGYMKDVRGIDITSFAEAQEIAVGSDTWTVFPSTFKDIDGSTANGSSRSQGIAYKKVTT